MQSPGIKVHYAELLVEGHGGLVLDGIPVYLTIGGSHLCVFAAIDVSQGSLFRIVKLCGSVTNATVLLKSRPPEDISA